MRNILNVLRGLFDDYLSKVVIILCSLMIVMNLFTGDGDAMIGWISILVINLILYGIATKFRDR